MQLCGGIITEEKIKRDLNGGTLGRKPIAWLQLFQIILLEISARYAGGNSGLTLSRSAPVSVRGNLLTSPGEKMSG